MSRNRHTPSTTRQCLVHGQPIHDASLCATCVVDLERNLVDLAALNDELQTMLARQDRVARPATVVGAPDLDAPPLTARVQPLPFDEAAGKLLAIIRTAVVGWVRDLHREPETWPADTVRAMTGWLLARVPVIRVHPAGRELADELGALVAAAEKVIDLCPDLWFAGICNTPLHDDVRCDERLYAEMRTGLVACRRCHTKHDIDVRRRDLLAAAEDQLETATHLAQALTRLGDPVTPERIRKWRERGRLLPHGVDVHGDPTYRVGEVRRLLDADRERTERRAG